jgi:hypothetical protein
MEKERNEERKKEKRKKKERKKDRKKERKDKIVKGKRSIFIFFKAELPLLFVVSLL